MYFLERFYNILIYYLQEHFEFLSYDIVYVFKIKVMVLIN